MRLAQGSAPFIWLPLTGAVLAAAGALYVLTLTSTPWTGSWPLLALAFVATLLGFLGLFGLWFFRDPERDIAAGIVCPADGKVLFVEPHADEDVGPTSTRIAVFMSPLNVHVNRAPVSGTVRRLKHISGGYLPAFNKESERNERVVTLWVADGSDRDGAHEGELVKATQIAGAVARRIVPWVTEGDRRRAGERYGLIRYGSRVDIVLPPGFEPLVKAGDVVQAGTTSLARRAR